MNPAEILAVFSIVTLVVASYVYFLFLQKIISGEESRSILQLKVLFSVRKTTGFLLFGIIPAIALWVFFDIDPFRYGLKVGDSFSLWHWIVGAALFFIILNAFNSKNPQLQSTYPEMRIKEWKWMDILLLSGGWILYLAGYEYLFRGFFLFSCYEAFGLWPAIVINISLYSALHLPKGLKEATAAIPFGVLICYLTIESGSIFPAVFLHSLQAASCEIFCIYRNPEMNFNLKKL